MTTTSILNSEDPQIQSRQETFGPVAVVVLALLLASVLVITVITPGTSAVRQVSVLLLAVSLPFALYGGWNGISVVFVVAMLSSTVAAYLAGAAWLGQTAGYVMAILWLGALVLSARWLNRNIVSVSKDRAILIRSSLSGRTWQAQPPSTLPLVGGLRQKIAEIPLYELDTEVNVANINTKAGGDNIVDGIKVHVRYRVTNAQRARTGIPNRSQVQHEVADQLGVSVQNAPNNVEFWERLLARQMESEVDDIVRDVVRDQENVVSTFENMRALGTEVQNRLDREIQRWGVITTMLAFEQVNVKPDLYRRVKTQGSKESDNKERIRLAELEAGRLKLLFDQLTSGEQARVRAVLRALREAEIDLTPEIVIAVVQGGLDTAVEGEIIPALPAMFPPEKKP